MRYRTFEGDEFTAYSFEELARLMWRSQFDAPATMDEWMEENAERARLWNDCDLRTDCAENHIADMMDQGLLCSMNSF